jgi:hypothetical protein
MQTERDIVQAGSESGKGGSLWSPQTSLGDTLGFSVPYPWKEISAH